MFAKLTAVLCVLGLTAAGRISEDAYAPASYSAHSQSAPAVSSVSYSTNAVPIAYNDHAVAGSPIYTKSFASYASAPTAELSYSAPLVTKTVAAAPALHSYTSVQAAPVAAYSSTPLVRTVAAPAFSSYTAEAAHIAAYEAAPVATKSFAAPAISTYESAPILTKAYAPAISAYTAEPVVTKTIAAPFISTYAAPVAKPAVSYSSAPAVSHVTYKGLDTSYSW